MRAATVKINSKRFMALYLLTSRAPLVLASLLNIRHQNRQYYCNSVPGLTKCHRVQTLFVIGVTITLVTSCWMRVFSLFPICFSQQLGAINPALLLPPSYKEGRDFGYR